MRRFNPLPVGRTLARSPRQMWAVLGPDARSAGQSLVALGVNSSTSLVAGAILGSITDTLGSYPGLLVMVPAAIGLRGNVFSALGSRVSTSIHTGEIQGTLRRNRVLTDNARASIALSLILALLLAVVAKLATVAIGVGDDVSVLDLATISVVGGALASGIVLGFTLILVAAAVRFGWDLDNLVAPVVSTLGDVITVPALWLATFVLGHGSASTAVSVASIVIAAGVGGQAIWTHRERLRNIVRESMPILVIAASLSTLAGVVLEQQFATFTTYPALLILVPAFVSSAGALGGLLSTRLATALHLGTIQPDRTPSAAVRRDVKVIAALTVIVYLFNGIGALFVAGLLGEPSPGALAMVSASLLGGVAAVAFVVTVAYYGTVAAVRLRVDPDTYGIPIVTSSVDFVGAVALILAAAAVGITT